MNTFRFTRRIFCLFFHYFSFRPIQRENLGHVASEINNLYIRAILWLVYILLHLFRPPFIIFSSIILIFVWFNIYFILALFSYIHLFYFPLRVHSLPPPIFISLLHYFNFTFIFSPPLEARSLFLLQYLLHFVIIFTCLYIFFCSISLLSFSFQFSISYSLACIYYLSPLEVHSLPTSIYVLSWRYFHQYHYFSYLAVRSLPHFYFLPTLLPLVFLFPFTPRPLLSLALPLTFPSPCSLSPSLPLPRLDSLVNTCIPTQILAIVLQW